MFMILSLQQEIPLEQPNSTLKLKWADGMAGALPVFEDYESAYKYAEGQTDLIVEIQYNKELP